MNSHKSQINLGKRMRLIRIFAFCAVAIISGCSISDENTIDTSLNSELITIQSASGWCAIYGNCGNFIDKRDQKNYKWTKITSKSIWMAENLNYNSIESICYNSNDSICAINGRLYKYGEAVNVCPSGWHLPDEMDWNELIVLVGGNNSGSYRLLSIIYNNGTDDYGFNALLSGANNIRMTNGSGNFGRVGGWWVYDENAEINGFKFNYIELQYPIIFNGNDVESKLMYSIRCVKNKAS